jgi:glutathione S-transferase
MKIYTYPNAPNPRRVDIYLAEKGIDVPRQHVDILKRENRSPEFVKNINVLGSVPVLELDDGSHIAESVAICRYFEVLNPEPPLFGRSAAEQATIEMWIRRVELSFMMPVGLVWVHGSPLTAAVMKKQIPEVAEQNRELVGRFYRLLEAELGERPFVAGNRFTMADIMALCTMDFATELNDLPPPPSTTNIARWHAEASSRPSARVGRPGGT